MEERNTFMKIMAAALFLIVLSSCSIQYSPIKSAEFYEDLAREIVRSGKYRDYYSSVVLGSPKDTKYFDAVLGSVKSEMYHFYSPPHCGFFEFCLGFSFISDKMVIKKIELTFFYENDRWVIGAMNEYIGIKLQDVFK